MRTTVSGEPSVLLAEAHELLERGRRDEAYQIAVRILQDEPTHQQARALRDRLDSEDFSRAVVLDRNRDIMEETDETPVMTWGILMLGIAFAVVATYLAYKPVTLGFQQGFSAEISMGGKLFGQGKYPIHFLLFIPTMLYVGAGVCFWAFRRFTKRLR